MPETETQIENIELVRQTGNVFWVGLTGFCAKGERVAVRQDEHKSGYECLRCMDRDKRTMEGKDVSVITCEECKGEGTRPKAGNANLTVKCSDCDGRGYLPCPDCKGTGTSTGIVLPDSSKSDAMTGIIVSIGPDVKAYKLGDRVMFPSYAGALSNIKGKNKKTGVEQKIRLRFIQEGDIIAQLYGELEMRSFDGTQLLYTSE